MVVAGAVALVVGETTGRLDDTARALGIRPHPESAASDTALLARVATQQGVLLSLAQAAATRHPPTADVLTSVIAAATAQLKAVGGVAPQGAGPDVGATPAAAMTALSEAFRDAADKRAGDAVKAVSPDLVRVLASMSAGLAQLATVTKAAA